MPRKDPHDELARLTASIYLRESPVYEMPFDWRGVFGRFRNPEELNLNRRITPFVIGNAAVQAMLDKSLDPGDFKLQTSIARKAVKYIPDYENINDVRQRTADRLNNPVH